MRTALPHLVLLCVMVSALALASTQHQHDEEPAGTDRHAQAVTNPAEQLSPELRALLNREMALIADGMGDLVTAISLGEWETVEEIAGKISGSFILKQQLGKEAVEELHAKLPDGFIRMDAQFHETAGRLAHVAQARSADLAVFYYSRLLDGCVNCHAAYAPKRFPGLATGTAAEHGR